ncbi:MAG: 50S ribosomal protein L15e [Candidatus Woesearchaeota archaeon]
MGIYKFIREHWTKQSKDFLENQKKRLIEWRNQNSTVRIEKPTRLDKARSLGYRAKQGFILIRQRVSRGGRQRPDIKGGRRQKTSRQKLVLAKNYQQIAEERAARNYKNCEVLNSYMVGKDGLNYWFEIILVDRNNPSIIKDKRINWIINKRGRTYRGITSAGRKSRGLRGKGKGFEKARPSARANKRKIN